MAALTVLFGARGDAAAAPVATVFPLDYGAVCDGRHDDTVAFRAAAEVAEAQNRPLFLGGPGLCIVSSPIAIHGPVTMIGDGEATSRIETTYDGPLFDWDVGPRDVMGSRAANATLIANAPAPASRTVAFRIRGRGGRYFQFNTFENLTIAGFHEAFDIDAGVHTPATYVENLANWNTFDKITIVPAATPAVFGWFYPNGSGTGTAYKNIRTLIDNTGAVFRFEGTAAVGDLLISGHFGGSRAGAKIVSLAPGTTYNQNIQIVASQIDAQATIPFDIPPSTAIANLHYEANNSGGETRLMTPVGTHSAVISDLGSDARTAGRQSQYGPGVAIDEALFRVTFPARSYTGTQCTVVSAGLVGGVAGGVTTRSFLLAHNGGFTAVVEIGGSATTNTSPRFFAISAATGSDPDGVTFRVAASPEGRSSASTLDAQIRCTGGSYALRRL